TSTARSSASMARCASLRSEVIRDSCFARARHERCITQSNHVQRITDLQMKAYDIKKGNVVEHNGTVYQVRDIERSSPQGRGGNVKYRFTMYSVPGATKYDLSCGAEDELREVDLSRREST